MERLVNMEIRKIINLPKDMYHGILNRLQLKIKGIPYPDSLRMNGKVLFYIGKGATIDLGDKVTINSSIDANHTGGKQEHTIISVASTGRLKVGNRSGISNSTIYCKRSITIGDDVNIGVDNVITDCDSHSVSYMNRIMHPDPDIRVTPIIIEDGVWICANCMILKGVTIGARSVIAAGSVVTHDVPPDELWGGAPARFIKRIN